MPVVCPCGGGKECVLSRRSRGEWIHEDAVLVAAGLPIREHCLSTPTKEQRDAMDVAFEGYDSFVYQVNGRLKFYWIHRTRRVH